MNVFDKKIDLPVNNLLHIEAKEYLLGIGCRQNSDYDTIINALNHVHLDLNKIAAITTINILAYEKSLLQLARDLNIPFITFSKDELLTLKGDYDIGNANSILGINNICERAACLFSYLIDKNNYQINVNKNKEDIVTLENRVYYKADYIFKKTPFVAVNISVVKRHIELEF